jgi:hypothetical protein
VEPRDVLDLLGQIDAIVALSLATSRNGRTLSGRERRDYRDAWTAAVNQAQLEGYSGNLLTVKDEIYQRAVAGDASDGPALQRIYDAAIALWPGRA